jgi:putative aldouronate transport system substrate-binding protein
MKAWKCLSVLLPVVLIFAVGSLLIGCQEKSAGSASSQTGSSASLVTPPGEFPVVKEKVTLRFFAPQAASIEDMETNEFTLEYEKKTNVHIEWELVPSASLAEKKSLSLASGDYPDVYFASAISLNEEMLYGPVGVFIPLNDLLDKYSIHFNTLRKAFPTIDEQISAPDGNIYTLPLARQTPHTMYQRKMWINETWLKKLGLSAPATTDEFYNMLKAFKTLDPNSNGKPDEIPTILFSAEAGLTALPFLMNSFIYDDGINRIIIDDNNRISLAFMQDGWKEGLTYHHKLYEEGLMDKSSFTITRDQIKQLVESGSDLLIGAIPAQGPHIFSDLSGERHKNFSAIAPLKGPKGVQYAAWEPYNHVPGTFAITSACKYPEVAIRWVDYLYSFDGSLRAREGIEGKNWIRPAAGVKSYAGIQATWERAEAFNTTQNVQWNGIMFPHNMTIHNQQTGVTDVYAPAGLETRLYRATELMMPYVPKKAMPPIRLSADDAKDFTKIQADINSWWMEAAVQFITGDMDPDKDWNRYITNFDSLQVTKYLSYLQNCYDKFLANNK